MLVSHPNVTYVGRFRHQLWKVSAPAGEANVQGPQPKTASQVTSAQKQKEQPHTAHLRFWLDASASFPRALLSSPSFLPKSLHWHQTPDPTAKPLLASGPYLHWTSKFQRVKAIRKQKEGLEQRDTFLFPHNKQLQHTGKQRRSGVEKNLAVPLQHGSYRGNSKV